MGMIYRIYLVLPYSIVGAILVIAYLLTGCATQDPYAHSTTSDGRACTSQPGSGVKVCEVGK